jgi:hypothetical protein
MREFDGLDIVLRLPILRSVEARTTLPKRSLTKLLFQ